MKPKDWPPSGRDSGSLHGSSQRTKKLYNTTCQARSGAELYKNGINKCKCVGLGGLKGHFILVFLVGRLRLVVHLMTTRYLRVFSKAGEIKTEKIVKDGPRDRPPLGSRGRTTCWKSSEEKPNWDQLSQKSQVDIFFWTKENLWMLVGLECCQVCFQMPRVIRRHRHRQSQKVEWNQLVLSIALDFWLVLSAF